MPDDTANDPPWANRNPTGKRLVARLLPWLGGAVLLGAIAWGLWPKPVTVETGVVARGPLTVRVSEEGKTRIRNRYIVAAPVAGKMRRLPLKPGDEVKAGETLLTSIEPATTPLLDPRARTQAEAAVSLREAARKQAAEALDARVAAAKMTQAEVERVRSVTNERSLSQSERDRAEMEASMKAADVRAAEFALQVANYELAEAKAALDRPAAITAGNLVEVKSPVSGRVLKVMQESETIVTPGMQIVEIGDPADIEIEAEILSRDAVAMHPGDAVEIEQWGGEKALTGRVRRVEPAAFTKISALGVEEQRVIVLCDLVNPPMDAQALGDRYRVEVRVAVWHADNVLTVPAGGLFRQGKSWSAFLMSGGKAKLTAVQAGHTDGQNTEVLGGLKAGEEVLLHPPDTVKDGTSIQKR